MSSLVRWFNDQGKKGNLIRIKKLKKKITLKLSLWIISLTSKCGKIKQNMATLIEYLIFFNYAYQDCRRILCHELA